MADTDTAVLEHAAPDTDDTAAVDTTSRVVVSLWLSDSVRSRLLAVGGLQIVDELARLGEAELVVASTRIPPGESADRLADVRTTTSVPIVVIVHPGGEDQAVELLAAGATGVIAEGNEPTVAAFFGSETGDSSLLDAYEQSLGRRSAGGRRSADDRDPVTRLRGAAALDARLGATGSGSVPRLAWIRVVGFSEAARRMSVEARDLLRRRLASQFEELCGHFGAEIFCAGPSEFAVVSETLSSADVERLGHALTAVTTGFSPDRAGQLTLAIGHAGPEATSSLDTLRDFAIRGMQLAVEQPDQGVIGADRLALTLASSTELETAFRAVRIVESRDAYPDGHGERVARHAAAIAEQLGLDEAVIMRVRLAARLHDIGKLTLPPEAVAGTEETLSGTELDAFREYPSRGGEMLRAAAGSEIAEIVARHHERWDGNGFPDGLTAESIPIEARIIAVADALDRWSSTGDAPDRPTADALQKAVEQSEQRFDPSVVAAATAAFAQ